MRRLSPARDRELRHAEAGHVAWRHSYVRSAKYAWCRFCEREVSRQMYWLVNAGFIEAYDSDLRFHFLAPKVTDHARLYLEEFPK
mgnify:CR=1 FL=1